MNWVRVGARKNVLPMATVSVVTEKSSLFAANLSPPRNSSSSVRRSLASNFTRSTSEQALGECVKPGRAVCNQSSTGNEWRSLGVDESELSLALSLPTGQSFRWKLTGDGEYTGVVDKYLFTLRQTPTDVEYVLHNPCTCSAGLPSMLCHETHTCSVNASQTEFSKNEAPTSIANAGKATSYKRDEAEETKNIHVVCHAIHDPHEVIITSETTGITQNMGTRPIGSNSADTTNTGDAIYLGGTEFPRSCRACLDTAEVSLQNYFNLDKSLKEVWAPFVAADARFAALAPHMRGARLLRQRPLECLFQFICSSNNHIQRISHMVDYLAGLGPYLGNVSGVAFHAFPTVETLAKVTEAELRKAGFGYRAKYIVGAVKELELKKGGGEEWLNSLRGSTLDNILDELCSLPGIGPKVAACIALFSLDQHHAIPVDTHVWQIATNYIMPELSGGRLTAKLHAAVSEAFVKRFGKYAGWAQNVLFIAELSSHQSHLPEHLRTHKYKIAKSKSRKRQKADNKHVPGN